MTSLSRAMLALCAVVGGSACGSSTNAINTPADAAADQSHDDAAGVDEPSLVKARPFGLAVPKGYDATHPAPLILLLHGYSATGAIQLAYFGLDTLADARTVFVAYPDGTVDSKGNRFWEGTDACCDLDHKRIDDVAYLTAVVHDVQKRYAIDAKNIFVVGHSNGAFMAHRLGCERADLFASVFSLAGAQWTDQSKCHPSRPVSVVELHGDADATISYLGGNIIDHAGASTPYPAASQTVADWAALDGCLDPLTATGKTLDLDTSLAGSETKVQAYGRCTGSSAVELWTMTGGGHIPSLGTNFSNAVLDFLLAHPMPPVGGPPP